MAAAGAASLVRPAAGLAGMLDPATSVSSRWVGTLSGASSPIAAPRRFALAGVEWAAPRGARIELRARTLSGRWTPWALASSTGHDADAERTAAALFGEPLWTGPADQVELRTDTPVRDVRLHFVTPPSPPAARAASGLPLARPLLDAGPGQPPIIAREVWAQGQAPPSAGPFYGTIKVAFVHHTVNPNGYSAAAVPSLLLGIFQYHRYVRGYFDIAYNFLVDEYGRVWEGRAGGIDSPVRGAHAGAYNAESTGVAVLGDFTNVVPTAAAIDALERLLAWKMSLHGRPTYGRATVVVDPSDAFYTPFAPGAHVSLPRVAGHRDGDQTDCPGNAFYARLPSIRPRVTALAGTPARLSLSIAEEVAIAERPVTASGRLHPLGHTRGLAGEAVEVQRIHGAKRLTLASAATSADGSWNAEVAPSVNVLLRALHRSHPAVVTDWVALDVAPNIALEVASASPLAVSGTVKPRKDHVTVELHRGSRVTGKLVRTRRLRVSAGRFAGTIRAPGPGAYTLIARSAEDGDNVAGASAPVHVTIT
ncbi:MAG TPA: peptidoglycan recognition protein [Solirubrobacteraceae bacterium]